MTVLTQFEKRPLLFKNSRRVISCFHPSALKKRFDDIEAALREGFYVAGFLSYEAGYCFEETLTDARQYDFPLIYMGVYDAPQPEAITSRNPSGNSLNNLRLNISQEAYSQNISIIRDYIAAGDVYQITYCIKFMFEFSGDPFTLYNILLKEQPVPYPAYIETADFYILSCSPEMFLKKEGSRIETRPMKGTWPRSQGTASDIFARFRFKYDHKNRAENVMIADLLRNDLGRVGLDIRAPKLFEVTGYRTLYQMTSTVTANIDKDVPIYKLFASVFPSGSVTGAPKIRAMQIIREIESEQRMIYTGAIGYITPDKDLFFNIPIRTILIRQGSAQMGIGGGIVWDSTAEGEWQEGLLKARFLTGKFRKEAVCSNL